MKAYAVRVYIYWCFVLVVSEEGPLAEIIKKKKKKITSSQSLSEFHSIFAMRGGCTGKYNIIPLVQTRLNKLRCSIFSRREKKVQEVVQLNSGLVDRCVLITFLGIHPRLPLARPARINLIAAQLIY